MKQGKLWGRFWFGLIVASLVLGQAPSAAAQDAGALFVPGPYLNIPRMRQCIATLTDGQVVVFGGLGYGHHELDSADVWNPGSNTFTLLPMNHPRYNYAFARMIDGRYLLAGGAPAMETAECFDPGGPPWFEPFSHLNIPRQGCSAATLKETGKVVVVGGWGNLAAALFAEVMDPDWGYNFVITGQVIVPRSFPVVLPARGWAVVAGGLNAFDPGLAVEETEFYHPPSNSFVPLSPTLLPGEHGWQVMGTDYLVSMEAQQLPDGRYLLLAKRHGGGYYWEYKLVTFDPETREFARFETNPPLPSYPTTWLLSPVVDRARGKAYIPAYVNFNLILPVYLRLYTVDLSTGALNSPTGSSRQSYFPSGPWTLLQDGRLLTCGGFSIHMSGTKAVVNTLFATPGAKKPIIISPALELLLLQ